MSVSSISPRTSPLSPAYIVIRGPALPPKPSLLSPRLTLTSQACLGLWSSILLVHLFRLYPALLTIFYHKSLLIPIQEDPSNRHADNIKS